MSPSFTKFLKISIPLAIGIFLIWYSYTRFTAEQLEEIKSHFRNANYAIVALAVFLSVLSHVFRAVRWNFMLAPLGYQPKILNNFMAVSIAYLMNIFIPKSGEISRALVIDKYEGVPFDKAFGTIISERVVDLIFLLGFTAIALFLQFDEIFAYMSEMIQLKKLIYGIGGLVGIIILFLLFLKFSKSTVQQKIKVFLIGLLEGVFSILKMKRKALFLLFTFFIWGLYLLSFYTATFALEETSSITTGTLIITFVVGSFIFAFTNSGFGSYPFFIAGILAVFGIATTVGTAFGWIVWTSNISVIILFGILSFFMLPVYNRVRI